MSGVILTFAVWAGAALAYIIFLGYMVGRGNQKNGKWYADFFWLGVALMFGGIGIGAFFLGYALRLAGVDITEETPADQPDADADANANKA